MAKADVYSSRQRVLLELLFDENFYQNQRFLESSRLDNFVDHYLMTGWINGLDPSPTFRTTRYLNATPGLRAWGQNPFCHYLFEELGEAVLTQAFSGLNALNVACLRAAFDTNWYLATYAHVEESGHDPFIDYMVSGWQELRDPSRQFSTASYLERYADIRDGNINPFQHWVLHGVAEGRSGEGMLAPFSSWASLNAHQQSLLSRIFSVDYYYVPLAKASVSRGTEMAQYVCSPAASHIDPTPSFHVFNYVKTRPVGSREESIPLLEYLFVCVGEEKLHEVFDMSLKDIETLCESFDAEWYFYSYPEIEASGQDAFIHYMTVGWHERRDPSPVFSTNAYLLRYPDIAECKMNPFLHWVLFGRTEGRSGESSSNNFRNRDYTPSVTAVIVNLASDPLSAKSVEAVLRQSYDDMTILVLGEALSQSVLPLLEKFQTDRREGALQYLPYAASGTLWEMLEYAAERATGDLLWFINGPGIHDVDYLARLTSSFADGSVQLGFGRRVQLSDALEANDRAARMGSWKRHSVSPAAMWFADNLKPESFTSDDSFLWRRRRLNTTIWREASAYGYLGFWHLYLHMASGGQVASVRDALVCVSPEQVAPSYPLDDIAFYNDVNRLAGEIRSIWPVAEATLDQRIRAFVNLAVGKVDAGDLLPTATPGEFGAIFLDGQRIKRHVLIVAHGIFAGGAENFPIQLANELVRAGVIVSMLIFKTDDINVEMRATMNPGVSIYEAEWVLEYGCSQFIHDIGCSLIHSHGVVSETFFFDRCDYAPSVPYVATLHGSYEASTNKDLPQRVIAKIVRHVDLFVYTADKNLKPLLKHDVAPDRLVKLINAMPIDETPFPRNRSEMGIAEEAVVFTLVARGIKAKGWSTAIRSFKTVQKMNPDRKLHLCLVGEGEEPDRLEPIYRNDRSISFLGFQLRIHGLYRISDVAIVPTRFSGESFPLCIIQALQVAVPVIATDIGEIASMLQVDGLTGGIIVENDKVDNQFEALFTRAMHDIVDDDRRKQLSLGAASLGENYDMTSLTGRYLSLYEDTITRFTAGYSRATMPSEPTNTVAD